MLRLLSTAALTLALVACGGEEADDVASISAGDALSYLPADSGFVLLVSTDLDSDAVKNIENTLFSIGTVAREAASEEGVSFEDDIKPLLGHDLVAGSQSDAGLFDDASGDEVEEDDFVAALEVSDQDKLRETLDKFRSFERAGQERGADVWRPKDRELDIVLAADGDAFLVAEDRNALVRALEQRDADDHLTEKILAERLLDLPADAPVRAFGGLRGLQSVEQLERFRGVPWVQALRSFGVTLAGGDDQLRLDVALNTDPGELDAGDLPVVPGGDTPEVVLREREISAANRNQSQTTVFLLRAMRAAYPDSRFVRTVERVEQELGIDFEREVLRQFDGPSASYVSPDGQTFAARSQVRDPEGLRRVLPRLAPHLPGLVEGLQGLQSEGMALLFLFAPDAPAAGVLRDVRVRPPSGSDGLYRLTGLTGDGPSELHFGVIGDVFVVASDAERAREIATADTDAVDDARGAGVLRVDLTQLEEAARERGLPLPAGSTRELVLSIEASTERVHVRLRLEVTRPLAPFFGN